MSILIVAYLAAAAPALAALPDCLRTPPPPGLAFGRKPDDLPAGNLTGDALAERDTIHARTERLASAFLAVEDSLRQTGREPDDFPSDGLSWVAVRDGDELAVAIHERTDAGSNRVAVLGTDGVQTLFDRLVFAEQALTRTPRDCGRSHGVIDAGLADADGRALLYALTLAARRTDVAWGTHYRFTVEDGELGQADPLLARCAVGPDAPPPAHGRQPRLEHDVSIQPIPGHDLPPETYLMQLLLKPDRQRFRIVWMRDKIFHLGNGVEIPTEYLVLRHPCVSGN